MDTVQEWATAPGRPGRGGRERTIGAEEEGCVYLRSCRMRRLDPHLRCGCGPACGVRASPEAKHAADAGPAAPLAGPP